MVLAIHDVSFSAHPDWFPWRERYRRRILGRLSAHRAARVLTLSAFSQYEIVSRFGLDAARVEIVLPGVTTWPQLAPTSGPRHVLYVGSVFTRRHVPELLHGFARLQARHANVHLTLVGQNRTTPRVNLEAVIGTPASRIT